MIPRTSFATRLICLAVALALVPQSLTAQTATVPNTQDPAARQLEQIEPLKSLPSKAKRWAIVVGVDKYADPQISPLRGAANDARVLADALVRYSGFPADQVILLASDQPVERQPTRTNLLRRLSNLAAAVPKDGLLLLSFSGHGMERGGKAFLLPSDAQISDQIAFLEDTALSVTRVHELIKSSGVSQVIVLLDACRNDPGGRADAPNNLTQAYVNGFNFDVRNREVQAYATIYATAVGQRAYEYTEKKQGYFTWSIVEALKGGGAGENGEVTLASLVRYVQDAVPKRIAIDLGSGKEQRPFATIEGYKAEELVLSAPGVGSNAAAASIPQGSFVDPAAIELSFWDSIKNSSNPEDFRAYLEKYPEGQFASLARLRSQAKASSATDSASVEMAYWSAIKDSKNSADFKAYQAKFPNGVFADLAASRVVSLEAEEREREKARLASEALTVDSSLWLGEIQVGQAGAKYNVRLEFMKGGVFSGTYNFLTVVPGIFINDYKVTTVNLSGTWSQRDDVVSVQVSQPSIENMKLTVTPTRMQGASDQGTYKFSVEKVLMQPLAASPGQPVGPCEFQGFRVKILYRKKDKVDRTQEAMKLQERLKSYGIQADVEKLNSKDSLTGIYYYNGQSAIADKLAGCIKDVVSVKTIDGQLHSQANQLTVYLQL